MYIENSKELPELPELGVLEALGYAKILSRANQAPAWYPIF